MQFSQIFEEKDVPDHFIASKNNILLILLCFTVYSIYQLFSDYLDTILLAVLTGSPHVTQAWPIASSGTDSSNSGSATQPISVSATSW
jgi:hypothetical protein